MDDEAINPHTRATLIGPRLALASCVRAYFARDTTCAPPLSEAQRSTWFPSTPTCAVSWFLEGQGGWVRPDGEWEAFPGQIVFSGPRSQPTLCRSPGPVRCFMAMLMPDAVQALTGLDVEACVDRVMPLRTVLGEPWQRMAQDLALAETDEARVRCFEDFLQPLWQQARARSGAPTHRYRDWVQALAVRAVAGGRGRSLRQMERRIKQWSGQTLRHLHTFGRSEQGFLQARKAAADGQLVWAEVAQDAGYADQSHLCRETRRVSGFSPDELRRRIGHDEAFWAYRVWE